MKNVAHNGFSCPYCRKVMIEDVSTHDPELPSENIDIFEASAWSDEVPEQWTEPIERRQIRNKPSVEEITQKLTDQRITMRHFVQAFLKDHIAYDTEELDFMRVDDEIYERIEEIIENAQY